MPCGDRFKNWPKIGILIVRQRIHRGRGLDKQLCGHERQGGATLEPAVQVESIARRLGCWVSKEDDLLAMSGAVILAGEMRAHLVEAR